MGRTLDSNETGAIGTVSEMDFPDLLLKYLLEVESVLRKRSVRGDDKEPVIVIRVRKKVRVEEL